MHRKPQRTLPCTTTRKKTSGTHVHFSESSSSLPIYYQTLSITFEKWRGVQIRYYASGGAFCLCDYLTIFSTDQFCFDVLNIMNTFADNSSTHNLINPKSVNTEHQLVFAIQFHNPLGVLIVPYMVQQAKDGQFMIGTQRLYSHTVEGYFDNLSEPEKQLMKLTDECSDLHLSRKFSKTARKAEALYNELTESKLHSIVIPYVQSRLSKCLELMQTHGVDLYFKGEKDNVIDNNKIIVAKEEAKAVFHFIKDETGLRYRLSLHHNAGEVPMLTDNAMVLVEEPGWILAGQMACRLEAGVDGNKVKPFFKKEFVSIPASFEEKYYRGFMRKVIKNHQVTLEGIRLDVETPACQPLLKLELDLEERPVFLLYFRYENNSCLLTDNHVCWVEMLTDDGSTGFRKTMRDLAAEKEIVQSLRELGLRSKGKNAFYLPEHIAHLPKNEADSVSGNNTTGNLPWQRQEALLKLIEWGCKQAGKLESMGIGIEQGFLKRAYVMASTILDINIHTGNDWFDIYAVAVFGKHRIPFIRLKNHLLNGIREYELPDGQFAILPQEWFSRYNNLLIYGQEVNGQFRMRKHHFRLVEQLNVSSESIFDESTKGTAYSTNGPLAFSIPEAPPPLDHLLRPYQRAGYAWLYWLKQNGFGGCLADDMGLGKTLQALTLLLKLKQDADPGPPQPASKPTGSQLSLFGETPAITVSPSCTSLIIMPLSLLHNWVNEIDKFAPQLRYGKYVGPTREDDVKDFLQYDVVLTTYGIARNDVEMLKTITFCYVILDESQLIKNPRSQVSEAVNSLQAQHRLVLTGTPVENSLDDLWSQLNFVNPGILGNLATFRQTFSQPVENNDDQIKKTQLREMIKPFILRRTKEQVEPELPPLTEKIHYCEMSDAQRKLYETKKSETRNHILEVMTSGDRSRLKINVLQSLLQLRLLANHPMLVNQASTLPKSQSNAPKGNPTEVLFENQADALSENRLDIPSGKFEEVIRMIENLMAEGHKVLIFSQFVKHLQLFREHFDENSLSYAWLTGQQKSEERKRAIADFQSDKSKLLFLVSLKAGGVGLNLTAADYVFILDPWWNPAVEKQAVSRAHRIGQQRHVFSYKFITTNSVEEKILKLQQAKANLAGDFISSNNPFSDVTDEEILELFS